MKSIKQKYKIKAPIKKVWESLVNPKIINEWGGGPAKMASREGTEFSLWGGDIYGKNIKVVENKELTQEWFQKGWEKPSKVTFKLTAGKDGGTEVVLTHQNIPDKDVKDIADGWKDYYLESIKDYLENNGE